MLIDIMLLGHLWYNKQANIRSKSNNKISGTTKTGRGGAHIFAYLLNILAEYLLNILAEYLLNILAEYLLNILAYLQKSETSDHPRKSRHQGGGVYVNWNGATTISIPTRYHWLFIYI